MQGHEAWLRLGLVASHNFQPSLFRIRETCMMEVNTLKPSQRWCAICIRALQTHAGDSNKTSRSPRPLPNHLYPSWNNHLIKNMYASIPLAITALVSFRSAASPKEPIDPRGCTIILPTSYQKKSTRPLPTNHTGKAAVSMSSKRPAATSRSTHFFSEDTYATYFPIGEIGTPAGAYLWATTEITGENAVLNSKTCNSSVSFLFQIASTISAGSVT